MATAKKTAAKKRRFAITFKSSMERDKAAARLGRLGGLATNRGYYNADSKPNKAKVRKWMRTPAKKNSKKRA